MKAIILSAGQGKRLMPLTADRPKCLIALSGCTLLEWQLRHLARAGVEEAVVVTGFGADQMDGAISRMRLPGIRVRTLHNPFYALADNLGSCWAARGEMEDGFLILNGDTLFETAVAERLLADAHTPITVTIDRKERYDADDMKVRTAPDGRLLAIGKTLPAEIVNGESIGFLKFTPEGGRRFREEVERALRAPEGLKLWYLSVIDRIARATPEEAAPVVGTVGIEGLDWGEMDFPADVRRNEELTRSWLAAEGGCRQEAAG